MRDPVVITFLFLASIIFLVVQYGAINDLIETKIIKYKSLTFKILSIPILGLILLIIIGLHVMLYQEIMKLIKRKKL